MLGSAAGNDGWCPRGKRISVLVISLLVGLVCGVQSAPLGRGSLLADDEGNLRLRVAELHEAMGSGDFAAWYRLSSSSALVGQHLSFDEFKRTFEDPYGRMQGWGVRQATLKEICNCADYGYPAGPRVLRCALLVDFVFNDSQKAEELEWWDGMQGQWYWTRTDAQRGCPALH